MGKGRKTRGIFWRDGKWWIRWACTLGHDHRSPSGNVKTAASEEQKKMRADVRGARKAGKECCPRLTTRSKPVLFEDILEDFLEYSRQTKRSHKHDVARARLLRARFGGRLASDITSKDVEALKSDIAAAHTPATVNQYLKLLKAVYNRAIRQERLTRNPVASVRLFQENNARNRCLSADEEERLIAALPDRLRCLVIVALHTGMRRGELRGLQWQDVDFATGTIRIRQDKAGDGRWVTMNSAAREALLAVKREQK